MAIKILGICNQYAIASCKIKINRLTYIYVNKRTKFHILSRILSIRYIILINDIYICMIFLYIIFYFVNTYWKFIHVTSLNFGLHLVFYYRENEKSSYMYFIFIFIRIICIILFIFFMNVYICMYIYALSLSIVALLQKSGQIFYLWRAHLEAKILIRRYMVNVNDFSPKNKY